MALLDGVNAPTITVEFDVGYLGTFTVGISLIGGTDLIGTGTSPNWVSVPSDHIRSISTRRGRTREDQENQPGTLVLVLDNHSGNYDPDNAASTFAWAGHSVLTAGMGVRVSALWNSVTYVVYRGYAEQVFADSSLDPIVTFNFTDGLAALGRINLATIASSFSGDTTATRLGRILDAAGWSASLRNITGSRTMQPTTYGNSVLGLADEIEACEYGRFFADRQGNIVLLPYESLQTTPYRFTLSDQRITGQVEYDTIVTDPGTLYLANDVILTQTTGLTQEATVADSILRFGTFQKLVTAPLLSNTTAMNLAVIYANRNALPTTRVSHIEFDAVGIDTVWPNLLPADLGDQLTVDRTTVDGRAQVFSTFIESLNFDITVDNWRVSMDLSPIGGAVPNAPTIGTATDVGTGLAYNNGEATVTFTPAATGATPVSYTATSSPGGFSATGGASPLTVTGLQSGVAYTFTVVANGGNGQSAASAASNSITATTVPDSPSISSVTDTGSGRAYNNGLAVVAFTAGATGGTAITSFTAAASAGGYSASGASSPLSVAGLQSGVSYTYTVTATNANGTSVASIASSAVTATTIPQPATIGTAADAGSGRAYNNGLATVGYTANGTGGLANTYTSNSSVGGYSGTGGSPISVAGLQSATAYTFTVTASNANGSAAASSASNSITATTIPQAPTIGTATGTGGYTASVAYTANATGGLSNTYSVTSSPAGGTGSGSSPISVTGLALSTSYTFTVTAANANGSATSGASNSITTPGAIVTGGTRYSDSTYYYQLFLASGTLGIVGSLPCDVLTIAGGGGPGNGTYPPAGGGAGGLLYSPGQTFTTDQTVTVGAGGAPNTDGGNSSVGSLTAIGGGGGADGAVGQSGGSGAGGSNIYAGGAGTSGQGFAGGSAAGSTESGAGGGAGAVGGNSTTTGANGGNGLNTYSAWASATGTGVTGYYAGGGAGHSTGGTGTGGLGGGAGSGQNQPVANTGSGGAVGSTAGATGIVIVRYLKTAV